MAGHKKQAKNLIIKQVSREPFITFPYSNKRKWGLAFGTIVRIKRGTDFDIVELNVGFGYGENFTRKFIAKSFNARKQVATLKCSQMCMITCIVPPYVKQSGVELICEVLAFWMAYVPTIHDRLDLESEQEKNNDTEILEVAEEKKTNEDFLAQFERHKQYE